jgi:predicted enzyme related to lactoylglutathione lyase
MPAGLAAVSVLWFTAVLMAVHPTMTLNHVAMTMPAGQLEADLEDLVAFYGEVFGWQGRRLPEEPGNPLLLTIDGGRGFVFVYAGEGVTQSQPMDHVGILVETESALDDLIERALAFRGGDPRVRTIGKARTPAGALEVVNAYVGFVLPLMVEIQHFQTRP